MEERKGFQDWGFLIKVGSVDPLMKVQARGLLCFSTLMARRGEKEGGKVVGGGGGREEGGRKEEGVGPVRSKKH